MNEEIIPTVEKGSNSPEMSVSELAFALKRTLEETYGRVRVRGELSRVSIPKSGHMYSSIKDDNAVIDVVCWKGVLSKLSIKPEEGLEVICTGRITTYPARSNYQLIIESMELAGEGALLKMLEERKKKLAAEGLFESSRKKKIPFLPKIIGVITSPTGAVIRDIMHRINDRFPRHVLLYPVLVQGDGAAEQVAEAIRKFNLLKGDLRPDILIVARGGGSLEDLMPFNEEIVVRAVAESDIAIISAVGHETDTSLCDYAADLRAPTPTGAAEFAVPKRSDLVMQILDIERRLVNSSDRTLSEFKNRLAAAVARLGAPETLLELRIQKIDNINHRLDRCFEKMLYNKQNMLTKCASRLSSPESKIAEGSSLVMLHARRLLAVKERLTTPFSDRLAQSSRMLESLSFKSVLKRGYVVVRGKDGNVITDAENVKSGQFMKLQFKDNKYVDVVAGKGLQKNKNSIKNKHNEVKQDSLF